MRGKKNDARIATIFFSPFFSLYFTLTIHYTGNVCRGGRETDKEDVLLSQHDNKVRGSDKGREREEYRDDIVRRILREPCTMTALLLFE